MNLLRCFGLREEAGEPGEPSQARGEHKEAAEVLQGEARVSH